MELLAFDFRSLLLLPSVEKSLSTNLPEKSGELIERLPGRVAAEPENHSNSKLCSHIFEEPNVLKSEMRQLEEPIDWEASVNDSDTSPGSATRSLVLLLDEVSNMIENTISAKKKENIISILMSFLRVSTCIPVNSANILSAQGSVFAFLRATILQLEDFFVGDSEVCESVKNSLLSLIEPLGGQINETLNASGYPRAEDFNSIISNRAIPLIRSGLMKDPYFVSSSYYDDTLPSGQPPSSVNELKIDVLAMAVRAMGAIECFRSRNFLCSNFSKLFEAEKCLFLSKLSEDVPLDIVYSHCKKAGLYSTFLTAFGARAAVKGPHSRNLRSKKRRMGKENDRERRFWVLLCENVLINGFKKEGVSSSSQSAMQLAVFGFFASIGKAAVTFLAGKGVADSDETMSSLLRYLEGACALFFPELANLLRYQLFMDVVLEEMKFLPFFPSVATSPLEEKPPITKRHVRKAFIEVILTVERWIEDFHRFSCWLRENPSSSSATFLKQCETLIGQLKKARSPKRTPKPSTEYESSESEEASSVFSDSESFPGRSLEELELEDMSRSLWLDKVTRFDAHSSGPYLTRSPLSSARQERRDALAVIPEVEAVSPGAGPVNRSRWANESNQIVRFPRLDDGDRPEIEESVFSVPVSFGRTLLPSSSLRSSRFEPETSEISGWSLFSQASESSQKPFWEASMERVKESTASAWRGVKLFCTDIFAATKILQHGILARSWTQREKKILQRTARDLATIVPISIIMLIPMTPVGHAAVLSMIKKWTPGLIPSSFSDERMEVAKQLEAMNSLASQISSTHQPGMSSSDSATLLALIEETD